MNETGQDEHRHDHRECRDEVPDDVLPQGFFAAGADAVPVGGVDGPTALQAIGPAGQSCDQPGANCRS